MCPRNNHGGSERSHIRNTDITIEQFKEWFPVNFLYNNVSFVYACGNNGDPIIAKDCLEIFRYMRENCKPGTGLSIHTNGSLRSKEWWTELAGVLGKDGTVVFAVDGFEGDHELYRRGTSWSKVIENAKAFIQAGGRARADTLIFKHNEGRILELKEYLLGIGFENVNLKPTHRFYGMDKFPVYNRNDTLDYYLEPAEGPLWKKNIPFPNYVRLVDMNEYKKMLQSAKVEPECSKGTTLYINAYGNAYPCCWVGSLVENSNTTVSVNTPEEQVLRDRLAAGAIDMMNDLGHINLNRSNILDELKRADWDSKIKKYFTTHTTLVCAKSCAKNLVEIIK
jgi:sulfatase maturation enzyme AslB (radical SAM superfamily)